MGLDSLWKEYGQNGTDETVREQTESGIASEQRRNTSGAESGNRRSLYFSPESDLLETEKRQAAPNLWKRNSAPNHTGQVAIENRAGVDVYRNRTGAAAERTRAEEPTGEPDDRGNGMPGVFGSGDTETAHTRTRNRRDVNSDLPHFQKRIPWLDVICILITAGVIVWVILDFERVTDGVFRLVLGLVTNGIFVLVVLGIIIAFILLLTRPWRRFRRRW